MRVDPLVAVGASLLTGEALARKLGVRAGVLPSIGLGALVLLVGSRTAGIDFEPVMVEGKGVSAEKVGKALQKAGDSVRGEAPRIEAPEEVPAKREIPARLTS